jgi:dipeptidyl aminopeptidase/acylaminoacyl peptidase
MDVVTRNPVGRIIDGKATAIVTGIHFKNGQGALMLFAQNLETGRTKTLEQADPEAREWVINADGVAIAQSNYLEFNKQWSLKTKDGRLWHKVYSVEAPIDTPDLEGLSADGKSLIISAVENEERVLKTFNLESNTFGPPLNVGPGLETLVGDSEDGRVIGGRRMTEKTEYTFFASEDQAKWDKAAALFPNADVKLESWSADHNKIVVHVTGPLDGDAYRLVDVTTGSTVPVGQAYAKVAAADVARVTPMVYTAGDGLKIPAYLTLPNGRPAKDLPLIVMPHGGPASRDAPGFNWWAQALASRGYAVLQPQFRGSSGWDKKLLFAGYGEFGRKMQSDLSDGVKELVSKGVVDAKRVCIVGGSYGGYAALAGAAFDGNTYRCAVSLAGVSDLRKFLDYVDIRSRDIAIRYWDRFLGTTSPDDPKIDAISPARHADKVNIPVLLIHGRDDTVVNFPQSTIMADALKRAGKPVELVELPGEDHWLSRSETRLQMLNAMVGFLEKNNPPQ